MSNLQVIFQNNRTSESHELSSIITGISWDSKISGSPSKVEISILKEYTTKLNYEMGSIVAIKEVIGKQEKNIFYGYLFNIDTTPDSYKLTFYDQLRYLVSNGSYTFKERTLKSIIETIADDFNLKLGILDNPKHIIKPLIMDNKKLLDIILTALDDVLIAEQQQYVFFDNYGKLELRKPNDMLLPYQIADKSLITSFAHKRGIDDSYNFVKLVQDDKNEGRRKAYIYHDSQNIQHWGKLQLFEVADEKMNPKQIEERANNLLLLHNREKETFSFDGIGHIDFRAGRGVYVKVPGSIKEGWYVIEEANHSFKGAEHTMNVKLRMV